MAASVEIQRNTEKILFVEDLVYYVMSLHTDFDGPPSIAESHREFVYKGFNKATRIAVLSLNNSMRAMRDIYPFIANNYTYTMLQTREKEIKQRYFPNGFDVNNFLPYCVHLTTLAADFYNKGVPDAPYLALICIVGTFEEFDLTTGGWDTLYGIAEKYATPG